MKYYKTKKEEKNVVVYNYMITCPMEYWEQFKNKEVK
jgi:hypothetical protein